jgi:hypothetical protein
VYKEQSVPKVRQELRVQEDLRELKAQLELREQLERKGPGDPREL